MIDFEKQINRMKDLMGNNSLNENKKSSTNIEYCTEGADGKIYGIIRENTKYYIKTSTKGNENIAESYDYIGGFCNRKDYEYNSYTNALKQLELKLMSLNEAFDKHYKTELLDPYKKDDLVIEGTEKMKAEIARQRQIMANAESIINEGNISVDNTGVPEAPKTSSFTPSIGEPFSDKATAKLDKDLNATASKPEKQGTPFDEEKDVTDDDMQSDKNPKCNSKCDCKDAEYVPKNSVANQKPKGAKAVKMNEGCDDWGSCGLPDDGSIGVGKDIPDVLGEEDNNIVGLDDSSDYDVMSDDEFENLINTMLSNKDESDSPSDDSMTDDSMSDDSLSDDSLSDDSMADDSMGDDLMSDDSMADDSMADDDMPFESKKRKIINNIVENITKKILKESKRNSGVGILDEKWFTTDKDYTSFYREYYSKLLYILQEIRICKDSEEINSLDKKGLKIFLRVKRVIDSLQNNKEIDLSPKLKEKLLDNLNSGTPEDVKTFLMSINDIWEQIGNIWDKKYAKVADKDFKSKNEKWNTHKVEDLNYITDREPDPYINDNDDDVDECKMPKKNIKEETTVLHDFGKHPGYRKKPMTLPSNDTKEKEGYKDWNDDSVKQDTPFGQKIGSSAPFDEKVKIITDAVMKQLKEMAKKKS